MTFLKVVILFSLWANFYALFEDFVAEQRGRQQPATITANTMKNKDIFLYMNIL